MGRKSIMAHKAIPMTAFHRVESIYIFIFMHQVCIVYVHVVKKVASFQGLSQLMGVVCVILNYFVNINLLNTTMYVWYDHIWYLTYLDFDTYLQHVLRSFQQTAPSVINKLPHQIFKLPHQIFLIKIIHSSHICA